MAKNGTRILLPLRERKANENKLDPFFPVSIMKYIREDGKYDGLQAIVNGVTGKTMGEVSEGYHLVTHQEASNVVHEFLDKVGMKYVSDSRRTGTAGAKFFETISFPDYAFSPEARGDSSAFDLKQGGHVFPTRETMVPYVTVKNSYDKTAALSWARGVARVLCTNGMSIDMGDSMVMSYRHNQIMDFDKVRDTLVAGIENSIDIVKIAYNRLNSENGLSFLRDLIEGDWPDKFRLAVLNKVAPYATIEQEVLEDSDGRKTLVIKDIQTPESAWSIYNIATDVATHTLTSPVDQDKIGRRIAKKFQIA